jgi:glycosyltransferase involved in cell wall biosynthesis
MAKIRVLYCLDAFEGPATGGTETQFATLIEQLPRDQFDVGLALLRPSRYLREHPPAYPVIELGIGSMASPRSWWRLLRFAWAARRQGYRLAHTFLNDSSICLPPFLKLAGLRVVISRRDLGFWYSPGILRALRLVRHCVDRVVVNSSAIAAITASSEGYPAGCIEVIHNGHFASSDARPGEGKCELRRNRFLLCAVANLKPIKRLEDAIGALARVRAAGEDVGLVLVGGDGRGRHGDSYRAELEAHARDLGVTDAVYFTGRVPRAAEVIRNADIGILCSESEGLPNSVIEYMLLEKPSVCTDVGGMRDVVIPGETGELVAKGDVEALAACILRLCRDEAHRLRLGRAARVHAERTFSVAAMVGAHVTLYRRLVGVVAGG